MHPLLAFGFDGGTSITLLSVIVLLAAFPTIFWIVELADAARRQFPDQTVKLVWLLVIFFTHVVGALVYYFVGKKQGTLPGTYTS